MKKILRFSLCLVLGLSLWGCKPANSLTKPDYVSIQIEEEIGYSPVNLAESAALNNLLAFSKWKTSTKTSDAEAVFTLIDDEGKTFEFIQSDEEILIRITDQGTKTFYTVTLDQSLDELMSSTINEVVRGARARDLIRYWDFRWGNLGNDWVGQSTFFALTKAQSEELKATGLLDLDNWENGGKAESAPTPDMVLFIDNDIILNFKLEGNLVRIYLVSMLDQPWIPTFTMGGYRFEKVMDYLRDIRKTFIIGPSTELTEAVFKKADFNLDDVKTWAIDGWSLNLSSEDSSQLSSILQIGNWIRIDEPFTFDWPTADIILSMNGGGTISFGSYGDYHGYGAIVERPGYVTEYYETGLQGGLWDNVILNALLPLWNPPFKDVVKTFAYTKIAIAYVDPESEMGYSAHVYSVNDAQRALLQAEMDYTSWTIEKDPWQFHRGWVPMLAFFDESGENEIGIFKDGERTAIQIRKIIPGLEVSSVLFYVAPLSVYEELWAVAKAQFE